MAATVRTAGPAGGIEAVIRRIVSATAPGVPTTRWRTMADVVDAALGPAQVNMTLMTGFAIVVLVLAGLGIYGLMAHSIAMREREIGLRMALGASPLLARMMFQVRATDPSSMVGVTLAVLVVALAACAVPAFRAARVQPMEALRLE